MCGPVRDHSPSGSDGVAAERGLELALGSDHDVDEWQQRPDVGTVGRVPSQSIERQSRSSTVLVATRSWASATWTSRLGERASPVPVRRHQGIVARVVHGEVVECDLPVRAGRRPVVGDREVIRGPGLAERECRPVSRVDPEPGGVDAFPLQEGPAELAVAVVADSGEDRRGDAEAREPGGDVAGEAADEAREALDLGERRSELVRVDVGEQAADDEDVDFHPWSALVLEAALPQHVAVVSL